MEVGASFFGALDAKVDASRLDTGAGDLWDVTQFDELVLGEPFQLPNDANRFSERSLQTVFGGDKVTHVGFPGNRGDVTCTTRRDGVGYVSAAH